MKALMLSAFNTSFKLEQVAHEKTKVRHKSYLLLAFLFICCVNPAFAQHMDDMPGMPRQSHSKNVFLVMMDSMMAAMGNASNGMSVAGIFMQEMIPHHQGAIDMAEYEIAHGQNFEMIQLAKSIKTEQNSEIKQMTLWLNQGNKDNGPLPDEFKQAMNETMTVMMADMPNSDKITDTDRAFASIMVPHHQAAIDMAKVLLKYSNEPTITSYAKQLISDEKVEIEQMLTYLNQTSHEN